MKHDTQRCRSNSANVIRPVAPAPDLLESKLGPPSANGHSIACITCQHPNSSDRKFCSSCGDSLWRKCFQCGADCTAIETFCGECGANQKQLLADRLQTIEGAIQKANQLRAAGDYSQAILSLRSLPEIDHSVIRTRVQDARRLAEELAAERTRLEKESEDAAEQSERWLEARRFTDVIKRLQGIPQPFRTERIQRLLQTAEGAYREIKALRTKIAEDVEARRLTQLGPQIDRYLNLQPDDEKVLVLAGRVRDHITGKAREALSSGEFEQASKLLECVPLSSLDDATKQLQAEVREFTRLRSELRQAAHVDVGLVAVASRLIKLLPNDEKITGLLAQVNQRLQKGAPSRRSPLIPWAVAPRRSHFGMPVEWLGGFQKLRSVTPDIDSLRRKYDSEFYVAAGLALQGLGLAHININLFPKEETTGLLGKLTRFRKGPVIKHAWGLDIGRSAIKAIKLKVGEKGDGGATILACEHFPYPMNLASPEAETQRAEIVRAALQKWKEKHQPTEEDAICVSCPATKTLGRFFQIPTVSAQKMDGLVTYEAGQQIPFPLTELCWGYQVLNQPNCKSADPADSIALKAVIVTAMRIGDAKDQLQPFDELGLTVSVLQAEAQALHNYLQFDGLPPQEDGSVIGASSVALLDVGSDATNFVISSPEHLWFRALRFGGNEVNQAAVRQFRLTFSQAEEVKRNMDKAKRLGEYLELLDQTVAKLLAETQRSLDAFRKEQPDRQVDRLWLCGGGVRQFGLLRHFRSGPLRENV
jgi:type IV pilus assembly protein PilM